MKTDAARKQASFVLRYALQSLCLILGLAVVLRVFLLSSYVMAGSSMLPSVLPGDFLVGLRLHSEEGLRGKVVALHCPGAREQICLRRVVGVAGDRVEFKAGYLWVNGHQVLDQPKGRVFQEERLDEVSWLIWPDVNRDFSSAPAVVPPKSLYLLNDRRADHEDSRTWGPLPMDLLDARSFYVWLSLDWYKESGRLRDWPRVRWERMLRSID